MLKKLEDILLEQGSITKEQYQKAAKEAQERNEAFLTALLRLAQVSSDQLLKAYSVQRSVPFLSGVTEAMADPALLGKIPLKFLRQHAVIPVMKDGETFLVTSQPADFQPLDELALALGIQLPKIAFATQTVILDAINRYYPLEGTKQMIDELAEENASPEQMALEAIEEKDLLTMAGEAPIIKLVNHIFVQAVKRGASDIHLEPYEKEMSVRFRIDGVMHAAFAPPKRLQGALISRIKIMANLDIAEKRLPQDGRIQIKIADKAIDIRVSVLPVNYGERIVMRLLDKSKTFGALESLGLSERNLRVLLEAVEKPNGILLVSGPTGSGKTSTLYSILSRLNTPDVNIITVEDPVEYQMQGIAQVQVKEKIGLTFAAALRSILRQDPDIVMIGETRDQETAQIAIQAALTGHFVLSTIHTNSAPATITRLLDMGIEPFLIASSIVEVIAQRLVRKLCEKCKQPDTPDAQRLKSIGISSVPKDATFYKSVGCADCSHNGYKGRLAIFEIMVMTAEMAQLTMERADVSRLRKQALADGMVLLVQDGIAKILNGLTTIEEVLRAASSEDEIT